MPANRGARRGADASARNLHETPRGVRFRARIWRISSSRGCSRNVQPVTTTSELIRVPAMSAGLYVLQPGEPDRQAPHSEDELYYVVGGRAAIRVGGEDRPVAPGIGGVRARGRRASLPLHHRGAAGPRYLRSRRNTDDCRESPHHPVSPPHRAALSRAKPGGAGPGYVVASSYELSHEREYHAIRNAAALFDVSPLYKYLVTGRDAAAPARSRCDAQRCQSQSRTGAVHAVVRRRGQADRRRHRFPCWTSRRSA